MKPAKHANLPLFIPHMGCPHRCVFCDQKSISGASAPDLIALREQIERGLQTLGDRQAEIAFFGGSFTAIDPGARTTLLSLANSYLKEGRVCGIRLSTRPDAIDETVLDELQRFGVTAIELGVQSMDDSVLQKSGRGHTSADTVAAFGRIRSRGCFSLCGQMMLGLPGSDEEKETDTARAICELGADSCRIYPTVVFRDTPLYDLWKRGEYTPLSLEEGVRRGAAVYRIFERHGVTVLRMGLCAEESANGAREAGCYHPAYGELVRGRLYFEALDEYFAKNPPKRGKDYTVCVAPGRISCAIGQGRENKLKLSERYGCRLYFAERTDLSGRDFAIEEGKTGALKITGTAGL